jgi:hypothetical protein
VSARGDVQYIAWQNAHCSTINIDAAEGANGRGAHGLREGDRVVYVGANKPNDGMTNAMTDRALDDPQHAQRVGLLGGRRRPHGARDDPQLAYCITVHRRKVGVR